MIIEKEVVCLTRILVIGAGLSGCTAAEKLARCGAEVTLVEKAPVIGGRVRSYGCKATDACQDCGVCLSGGLWDKVSRQANIRVITGAVVKDITGVPGDFSAVIADAQGTRYLSGFDAIVLSTGFESERQASGLSSHLQIEGTQGLLTGTQLEELMLGRTRAGVFESAPGSVAFIQCVGSRDQKEGGLYCSRVCCAYSTRMAKVLRSDYPDCKITFFYMELQSVKTGDYFAGLQEQGMEFIKCRPLKISGGKPVTVEYDDPAGGLARKEFDLVVLSDGIHAGADNSWMAEVYGVDQDQHGFLQAVGAESGIYVAGCARTPLKIGEAYADSVAVAGAILAKAAERFKTTPAGKRRE